MEWDGMVYRNAVPLALTLTLYAYTILAFVLELGHAGTRLPSLGAFHRHCRAHDSLSLSRLAHSARTNRNKAKKKMKNSFVITSRHAKEPLLRL